MFGFRGNFVATCSVEFLSPAPGPALFLGVNCKKIDGSSVGSSLNISKSFARADI